MELLAPNGKPSNLTPEQHRLVRTPEFKAWFGDWENSPETSSKVVDENGEPLVVYHGSPSVFSVFKPSMKEGTHGEKDQIEGIYFTDSIDAANWYSLEENNPKYLKAVFLNIKKMFSAEDYKKLKQLTKTNVSGDISEKLKSQGYDGLFVKDGFYTMGLSKLYLCFYPNQIKLADGTNTTFDENNPDIRFKKGGSVPQSYIYFVIHKNNKPIFKTRVSEEKDYDAVAKMIEAIDQLSDKGYTLVSIEKDAYDKFQNDREGSSEFMKEWELIRGVGDKMLYGGSVEYFKSEFDDSGYSWKVDTKFVSENIGRRFKLSEIINHEELFSRYPNMKDVVLIFGRIKNDELDQDSFVLNTLKNVKSSKIYLNLHLEKKENGVIEKYSLQSDRPECSKEAALLHEIQHVCQLADRKPDELSYGRIYNRYVQAWEASGFVFGVLEKRKIEGLAYTMYKHQFDEQEAMKTVFKWLNSKGLKYKEAKYIKWDDTNKIIQESSQEGIYHKGGTAPFNKKHIPSSKVYAYALEIKNKYPKVWFKGGNIYGNEAFRNLEKVVKRGYWLDEEEWMYKRWKSFVARHHADFKIAGVVAMLKWCGTVDRGFDYMKEVIESEVKKTYPKKSKAFETGGAVGSDMETVEAYTTSGLSFDFDVNESLSADDVRNIVIEKSKPDAYKYFTYKGVKNSATEKFRDGGKVDVALHGEEYENIINSKEFINWFGDWKIAFEQAGTDFKNPAWANVSKAVDEDGKPMIIYHGTTHKWFKYNTKRGNPENDMGIGFYASSDYYDVEKNYLSEGADITSRISHYGNFLTEQKKIEFEEAKELARKKLVGSEQRIIPVFLNLRNPIIISDKYSESTLFEFGRYNDELDEYEDTEAAVKMLDALQDVADEMDYSKGGRSVWDEMTSKLEFGDTYKALDVIDALKSDYNLIDYLPYKNHETQQNEFIRRVFEKMGFDGVIYNDAASKFKTMEIPRDTKHYVAFNGFQIKLADGTNKKFDPKKEDIRFEKGGTVCAVCTMADNK